jgi:FG-GAP-like repeat/Divergent InlB B-repeat domain/FG-GAP repeat
MKILSLLFTSTANGCTLANRFFLNAGKFFALAVLGLCSMMSVASAQTAFYYSSPTGENVGGGRTRTFTAPTDSIIVSASGSNGIFAAINEVRVGSSNPEYWYVALAAPSGKSLTTGVYEGAMSNVYNVPSPTVNMYGTGSCGPIKGRFNILAIAYATDGSLASLAANFSQECDGSALALVAEIRFNSSVPLTTATVDVDTSPDPFALVMQSPVDAGASVTSLTTMVYGVNAPTPISITNGEYKINDGAYTSVASTVKNTDRVTVRVTASATAGGTVAPVLTIGGRSATTSVMTYSPGAKLSGVRIVSAPGDYVGRGTQRLFLAPFDSVLAQDSAPDIVAVSTYGRDGNFLSFQIAPPTGSAFVVGQYYENVKRFPFQDAVARLDVSTNSGGCNQIFGRFIVRELTKSTSGLIDSLAVDFEQRCENASAPLLVGEVRINSSIPFTSLPLDIRYGVKINKVGRGSGTVTAMNGELSCGFACTVYLPLGWNLSLAAAASPGSVFKGWEDSFYQGCSGALLCGFQVTASRIINARFEVPTKLTVVQTGAGTGSVNSSLVNGTQINCPSVCSADFDLDTTIVLNASAGFGSVFTGWSGGGCSGEASCTVTMNAAKTVQANFVLGYILSVTTDQVYGAGKVVSTPAGIDCGLTCRAVISPGGSVTLTAIANPGSLFVGWSGSCSGTAPCIVTMNQPRSVRAAFVAAPRRISVSRTGTGDGVVTSTNGTIVCGNTCDASFSPAVGIELVAIPVQGSAFVGWSGGSCSGSANCIISQTNDVTVTAIFNRVKSTLARTTDSNNDGKSDLLIQTASGTTTAWQMNGTSISSASNLLANQPDWTITHVADFNGDGKADILWRNVNGAVTLWLMDGSSVIGSVGLIGPDANWRVTDVADFNGDGKADILWRNTNGAVTLWLMNGTMVTSTAGILGPDASWRVSHIGDFNGDGKADLLWRNTNGAVTIWLMNGTTIISAAGILGADANWSVTHAADFNGDGKADLLWRNNNGAVTSWLMDGTAIAASAGLLGPDVNWSVTHTADFNGDSKADILWRNTNGAVTMWIMNGNAVASTAGLIGPDANWRVTHAADYDGDGKSDLLWRKIDGSLTVWVMNGTSATATSGISGATTTRVVP